MHKYYLDNGLLHQTHPDNLNIHRILGFPKYTGYRLHILSDPHEYNF